MIDVSFCGICKVTRTSKYLRKITFIKLWLVRKKEEKRNKQTDNRKDGYGWMVGGRKEVRKEKKEIEKESNKQKGRKEKK